eukprot:CAMPEP_0195121244 /NCGR_PEP_ID=MMETSP0448-20130528/123789_1 /TAXON_ID=66468 /ORGANISM="Heterocapsa triquestra, Strain CCMP 448" /LENGTH=58 /DNA_ID=CAMNT_0040158711 /DNA_START=33 /DNA_END=205 /DNA_ORIENTATION=+
MTREGGVRSAAASRPTRDALAAPGCSGATTETSLVSAGRAPFDCQDFQENGGLHWHPG